MVVKNAMQKNLQFPYVYNLVSYFSLSSPIIVWAHWRSCDIRLTTGIFNVTDFNSSEDKSATDAA